MDIKTRFWSKVKRGRSDECWPWTAGVNPAGYGMFWRDERKRCIGAHRMAWILTHGEIPTPLCVCHRCDTPLCCNPSHFFLGTRSENTADRDAKGRQSRGDRHWSRTKPHLLPRGERSGTAKMTAAGVREMRRERASGATLAALAARHGVALPTVHHICQGKTWRHLLSAEKCEPGVELLDQVR